MVQFKPIYGNATIASLKSRMYLDTRFSGRRYQVNLSLFLFRSRSSSSRTTISKVLILGLGPSMK